MKASLRWALLGLLALSACGGESTSPERSAKTAAGLYTVAWSTDPEQIPFAELFALDVEITNAAGGPVDGATLSLAVEMPAHGHGMQTTATVEPRGDGRYRIEGMKFHMRGTWKLAFTVDAPAGKDEVVFEEAFY